MFSLLQRKYAWLSFAISNSPLLLMKDNEILERNLKHARIEKSQLLAKLREANVTKFDQVLAVVLESTGDISVLHKSTDDNIQIDTDILEGVRLNP
tara:strand:- start:14711 stop:14998 length:288 start_codon:yes stop_codon:yes gene_type:complete